MKPTTTVDHGGDWTCRGALGVVDVGTEPTAAVLSAGPAPDHPGGVLLAVRCPWCSAVHWHIGAAHSAPGWGHRRAPCGSGGYRISDTEEEP